MERHIKENIERLLYSSKLSQSELSKKTGLSRQTINKISASKEFFSNSVEEYQNILIQNIKLYLRRWNQFSLSTSDGVRESTISNLVNGKYSDIYFSTIESLADEMGVSLADLFKRGEN